MRLLRSLLFLCTLLLLNSCAKPPVIWRYDPGLKSDEQPTKIALLMPVEDLRPPSNEDPSKLNLLPLVLYTVEDDEMFDRVLLQNGDAYGSVPDAITGFQIRADLHHAIKRQLAWSGVYGPVFGSRSELGQWSQDSRPVHEIRVLVHELSYHRKHLRYGFGPLAIVPHLAGAPVYQLRIKADISVEISDDMGSVKQDQKILLNRSFSHSIYDPVQAEQKALDVLGLRLRRDLESMIHETQTMNENDTERIPR